VESLFFEVQQHSYSSNFSQQKRDFEGVCAGITARKKENV